MSSEVMERRRATCMHCGEGLVEGDGSLWRDRSGTAVCITGEYGRDAIMHTPMPEGLQGAPK